MLARINRLTGREVGRLYKKGEFLRTEFMVIRFVSNKRQDSRFAVVIPKAVLKKAVWRNRLRRKIMVEIVGLIEKFENKGYDMILAVKAAPDETRIKPVLEQSFKRIGLIK